MVNYFPLFTLPPQDRANLTTCIYPAIFTAADFIESEIGRADYLRPCLAIVMPYFSFPPDRIYFRIAEAINRLKTGLCEVNSGGTHTIVDTTPMVSLFPNVSLA